MVWSALKTLALGYFLILEIGRCKFVLDWNFLCESHRKHTAEKGAKKKTQTLFYRVSALRAAKLSTAAWPMKSCCIIAAFAEEHNKVKDPQPLQFQCGQLCQNNSRRFLWSFEVTDLKYIFYICLFWLGLKFFFLWNSSDGGFVLFPMHFVFKYRPFMETVRK